MSTKTEIIYTYKSPISIPQSNIHALQEGSTGNLSIAVLDTQDYDYTYISPLPGTALQQFLPLKDGEDDLTTISSGVSGGTYRMLLQDQGSVVTIENITLNAKVTKFQKLNILNSHLEYIYDYIPPLIIDGATLNCETRTDLFISNAQLNLKLKKRIMNLPVILGAEFCIYGTRDFGEWRGPNGAGVWYGKQYRGWRTTVLVIHDEAGATFPAFTHSGVKNPFDTYQLFSGVRRHQDTNLGHTQSSIVRVKHPFGDPLSREDFSGIYTGQRKINVNNEILENQSLDFKWFIYNGLVDARLDYKRRNGDYPFNDRGRQDSRDIKWPPNDGDGFWKGFQINNDFNAMVSGGVKLFDHHCLYNTYFQSYVKDGLPNPDGLNENGQYLQTNVDNGNDSQSSFITNILYTTFDRYYNRAYTLSPKIVGGKQTNYVQDSGIQTFNEILNLANISVKPIKKFVAVDDKFFNEQQRVQQGKNYFYDYEHLQFDGFVSSRSSTRPAIRNLALPGGVIDLSVLNDDPSNSQIASIDTTRTFYNFNITNQLRSYKDLNDQTLQITDLSFSTDGLTGGLYGNVHTLGGVTGTLIFDLNTLSTGYDGLTGRQGSTQSLGSIIDVINNTAPRNFPIDISTESRYELAYNFSGKGPRNETRFYSPDELMIGSAQNDGQALVNPNAKIDVKSVIRNSIFNAGTTGRVFDITNWGLTGSIIKLNDIYRTNIPGVTGGKYCSPLGTLDISGYYEFAGNTGGGFTGREPLEFTLDYGGSTFMYSREAQLINIQGITFAIDITAGLTALIDNYSQEIHIPKFHLLGGMTGATAYTVDGIPILGITGSAFNPNGIVLWETAEIKVQYNTDLDPNGQMVRQPFASEDLTYVQPLDVVNTNPIYEDKEFNTPTNLRFPINKRDIKVLQYSDAGYYTTSGAIHTYDLLPTRDSYLRGPTARYWVKIDSNYPNDPASYIDSRSLIFPGNYYGKLIVYKDVPSTVFGPSNQYDYYCVVYTTETITPATMLPNFNLLDADSQPSLPLQQYYIGLFRHTVISRNFYARRLNQSVGLTGETRNIDGVEVQYTTDFDSLFLPPGDSDVGGSNVPPGRIYKYDLETIPIPSIYHLKMGNLPYGTTGIFSPQRFISTPNVFGKDFIDLRSAQLYMDYSYGEKLYSEPFSQVINLGETFGQLNPPQTTLVSKNLYSKEERITIIPYARFYLYNNLYLVNIRKNQTGYTFSETMFVWDIYDPATYKNYKIINHPFSGLVLDSNIDNLINLNDYTIDRTPGTNKFLGIRDIDTDPPIELSPRNILDNIALLYTDSSDKLTNIILNPGTAASVPYLHRFFKFKYLNDDDELFLFISSSVTGSTAIEADIEGLYVSLVDNDPNPFITSRDDYTYGLTNQLITFDLSKGITLGQYFDYNNVYLDPSLGYGTGVTSYSIDISYSSSAYPKQHSIEYFGFTGGSTASMLVKGLMPGITYRNNWLSYKLTNINEYISSSTGTTFRGSWGTGGTGTYLPNNVVFNDVENQIGNTFNKPDNNYYVNNSGITTQSPPIFADGTSNSIWKKIPLEPKSKIYNFEFHSGITGVIFSCNSNLTQTRNKVFSYNLRIRDASYNSYSSSSPSGVFRSLGTSSDPNYALCVDFNDPSVTLTKDGTDVTSKRFIDTVYEPGKDYIDVTITGLQRGKSYLASIYLSSRTDSSFISNKIFTTPLLIPNRLNLAFGGSTFRSPYSYTNTLLKTDVYTSNFEQETSLMNSINGYLYTIDESSGVVYSKQLVLADSNNVYGSFNPVTRDIPIGIRNLNPGTTFSNLTLRYTTASSYSPESTGTTATSTGLITIVPGENNINQYNIASIPEFTSPTGSTSGPGITGIIDIQRPQFFNSYLTITNFNFYNNDITNSYPEIYGGTAIVKLNSTVVGIQNLNPLLIYPSTIGITLDREKLNLGQLNNLTVSYQWSDFNNMSYESSVYAGGSYVLNYSVNIPSDQTTINIPFTSLFSKSIPNVNTLSTKVGDMNILDLKCDLIVKASLSDGSIFPFKGEYDIGNTYFSNWTVSQGSTFYALMGVTMSKGISPLQDRAWVELTQYLPAGKEFNTGNVAVENRDAFVYLDGFEDPYNNFTPFLYDDSNTNIYNINFGQRFLRLSYINGSYQGLYNNLIPNKTYKLDYIRSEIRGGDGVTFTLHSGSTSIGQTRTLMNYVGGDSLTGSTSTYYTLSNLHYNGSTSYLTNGEVFFNDNVQINYGNDNYYYFSLTGTSQSPSLTSSDWALCLVGGATATSNSIIPTMDFGITYKKGDLVNDPNASGELRGFIRDYITGPTSIPSDPNDPLFPLITLSYDNIVSNYSSLDGAPTHLDVPSTSYSRGNIVYNNRYSTGKNIVSQGVTFTTSDDMPEQDYLIYRPQLSINRNLYDTTNDSYIFYNGLTARGQTASINYNKVGFNILDFGLTGYNLDDYFVIKGGTTNKTSGFFGESGYTSVTGTINYYKEYKLRDYYYPLDGSFRGLVIDTLSENTTYSNFKLSYRYAYTNRLSNSIDLTTFTSGNGLEVLTTLSAGIRRMTANILSVSLEGISQSNLFRTSDPRNLFHFKMYKFRSNGINTAADQTDFNDITGDNNVSLPATNLRLNGADQGVVYDRIYFFYRLIDTDGSTNIFERVYNI
jgi:hypothetical protein